MKSVVRADADRRNLTGAQLRNRALTDTFEPGSTMKPFIAGWALETGRVTPTTVIQTAPGKMTLTGSTISDSHPHGNLTVTEVIQKSSNVDGYCGWFHHRGRPAGSPHAMAHTMTHMNRSACLEAARRPRPGADWVAPDEASLAAPRRAGEAICSGRPGCRR